MDKVKITAAALRKFADMIEEDSPEINVMPILIKMPKDDGRVTLGYTLSINVPAEWFDELK